MNRIDLWPGAVPYWDEAIGQARPSLTPYTVSGASGAIIICPGGGYAAKAEHEGGPIAEMLNRRGISAFVLDYRVAPYRHPAPLCDALRAVRTVRHAAAAYGIRPDRVGILGFSAGGHLAGSAGTLWDDGDAAADDPIDRVSSRPDALVLCYAVLSFIRCHHMGSAANLLGSDLSFARRRAFSLEECVTSCTPPTFLWHTADDAGVPVENSLGFAEALSRHGVPFALHIFPHGRHGLGLGGDAPLVSGWSGLCADWLKDMGF